MNWKSLHDYMMAVGRGFMFFLTIRGRPTKDKFAIAGLVAYVTCYLILRFAYEWTGVLVLGKLAAFIGALVIVLIPGIVLGSTSYGVAGEIMLLRHPGSAKARALMQVSPLLGAASISGIIGGLSVLVLYTLAFGGNPFEAGRINLLIRDVGCCIGGTVSYILMYRRRAYIDYQVLPLQTPIESRPPLPIAMITVDAEGLPLEKLMEADASHYRTVKLVILKEVMDTASLVGTIHRFEQSGPSSVVSIIITVEKPETEHELKAALKPEG